LDGSLTERFCLLLFLQKMDHIVESSTIEDFNDLALKKAKSSEPDLINGDLLPSPDSLESDRKINSHPLPSPTSPII
jgi:hypothetical protein